MNIIVWNCRGIAKPPFFNYAKSMIRKYKSDICCFLETRMSSQVLLRIVRFMVPSWDVYMLPSIGLSGGIIVVWRKTLCFINFTRTNRQEVFSIICIHN